MKMSKQISFKSDQHHIVTDDKIFHSPLSDNEPNNEG